MGSRLEQKSNLVRKRIEGHVFDGEDGEEYEGSKFGGFSDYFRRKKIKLQNLDAELRAQSTEFPQIFKGVVCHVNGYTQPSLNDLHTMIVQHGGGFIQYLDGKTMVTHIIASNLTPKKREEFKRYRIVKPAWIVDSIRAGAILPWDDYRVIDEGAGQKVLGFDQGKVVSQANRGVRSYREQTDASWYTSQLLSKTRSPENAATLSEDASPAALQEHDVLSNENLDLGYTSSIEDHIENDVGEKTQQVLLMQSAQESDRMGRARQRPKSRPSVELNGDGENPVFDPHEAFAADAEPKDVPNAELRPREGSQEPDFSHAVIRQSEVLRAISPTRLAKMTAEEHNALLLSDPKIRKSTVVNPEFLEQYYRESRLHHLSTWKADLKSQLQALASSKSSSQLVKQKRLPGQRRYIMHVDFDSFFAAVSLKKYPQFKDKPVVVAHGGGSGSEIASCNYPARKFGVSNGMWMKRAQALCPDLKILPYDFPAYEDASRKFYYAIIATGGVVQSVSIDECLVDISNLCFAASGQNGVARNEGAVDREQSKADEIAQFLRDEVFAKTGCAVSVGIGANILQAKVALRKAKPAGQYQLRPQEVLDFIGQLEVQKLPGVAWSIGGKLEEIGVKLVKDIWEISRERLVNTLGPKTGEKIWEYSRGIDKTEVGDQVIRKSVSAEVNWGVRFENQEQVDEFLEGLGGELHKRLMKERVKGKQLTMKVMRRAADAPRDPPKHLGHGKCDVFNRSLQLGVATNDPAVISKEAIAIMKAFCISPGELRGIGIQMQKLEPIKQRADGTEQGSQRKLQFKAGLPQKSAASAADGGDSSEPIEDDREVPPGQEVHTSDRPKPLINSAESTAKTRLNTMGTQFVLPTQVDPTVLAELPADIRAKLARHTVPTTAKAPALQADPKIQVEKQVKPQSSPFVIPPQSQIDPTILDALPEDLREEILNHYSRPPKRGGQAVLPQSPRKNRMLPPTRQPAKRGRKRGGGLLPSRLRDAANEGNTLTQSNFVARPQPMKSLNDDPHVDPAGDSEEIDPEVLAALPEDLRQEVLDQQRQVRLQKTGGIDLTLHQRPKAARRKPNQSEGGPLVQHFILPPRPPLPTFTSRKLSELKDLRAAISAWVAEFSDEGPYEEDTATLTRYLRDVVNNEKNLDKAVAVVRWLNWVIDEAEDLPEDIMTSWLEALAKTRTAVQVAAAERNLGTIVFD